MLAQLPTSSARVGAPSGLSSRRLVACGGQPPRRGARSRLAATRDVEFAYQKDISTRTSPSKFADAQDDRKAKLAQQSDWRGVVAMFSELGEQGSRAPGLVGDMLITLQRLAPPAAARGAAAHAASRLPPQDAALLANSVAGMSASLLDSIDRVGNGLLVNVVWALALLPDPSKTLATPAAAAARARAVAGFGAAVIMRLPRMNADELFHVCAGLALLGFRPPRTLERAPRPPRPGEPASQPDAGAGTSISFAALLESRSMKVFHFLVPKALADAGYVAARLVHPGDFSPAWLDAYAEVTKQHLPSMAPEALVHTGYCLARHGYLPSNSWQKAYLAALQAVAATLAGDEFPMALFTLARNWRDQRARLAAEAASGAAAPGDWLEQDEGEGEAGFDGWSSGHASSGGSGGGRDGRGLPATAPSQALVDSLLLASHTNRALRELPLGQLVVMLQALAELPHVSISPLWLKRVWPAVNAKLDAAPGAASAAAPADLAALLATLPLLRPAPELPADFLGGLAGNLGLGLRQLGAAQLLAAWTALRALGHAPDAIFVRQLRAALLAAVPRAAARELLPLLELGLLVSGEPGAGSGDSSGQAFEPALLQALAQRVERLLGAATGTGQLAVAARGLGVAGLRAQQQLAAEHAQLLDNASADGLWQLPQTLLACLRHLAAGSGAAAQQPAAQRLQQLWHASATGLAPFMPAHCLLDLLNALVDLPAADAALLGPPPSAAQRGLGGNAALVQAVMDAGVLSFCSSSEAAGASERGRSRGTSLQAAFQARFVLDDCTELLAILADAGLAPPSALLDAAGEVMHAETGPKGRLGSAESCSAEAVGYADDLMASFAAAKYAVPARVKSRYRKWRTEVGWEGLGVELPPSLAKAAARRTKAKAASAAAAAADDERENGAWEATAGWADDGADWEESQAGSEPIPGAL